MCGLGQKEETALASFNGIYLVFYEHIAGQYLWTYENRVNASRISLEEVETNPQLKALRFPLTVLGSSRLGVNLIKKLSS
ncbi:hypothetical protein TcasGA2_TC032105 [Tribolium castaneum]|uniref:Uncharacterized protein n=1 Tax=Tribolium castaneum TaxID=7070 RepID=A0A139WMT6_TRICA|nr:hypothetical protein TcasGA2_TC032105 [Tribolium castaneum]